MTTDVATTAIIKYLKKKGLQSSSTAVSYSQEADTLHIFLTCKRQELSLMFDRREMVAGFNDRKSLRKMTRIKLKAELRSANIL